MIDLITIIPSGAIGNIAVQATLEENYSDNLQITEHPVELGAAITDHAYRKPSELVMHCAWSNNILSALEGAYSAPFDGGSMLTADYVAAVYSSLLNLQQSRVLFAVSTSKRLYTNMLLTSLNATTDNHTSQILLLTATMREIIVVATQVTTLPPTANQANPASTAGLSSIGVVSPIAGNPSPGGSAPSSSWTG